VHHFPAFAEAICRKYCNYWDKVNENSDVIPNIYLDENSLNVCRLLNMTVTKVCRLGSGPLEEGEGSEHRPDYYIKQRSIYDSHHKLHGLSALTISFPNGMSTVIGISSTRENDLAILTWSELDDFFYNLCLSNGIPAYSLYADKGFSGMWLSIRTPYRGTLLFLLNSWQRRENYIMKQLRVRIEWAYSIMKSIWKLIIKYLYFKLDQNSKLCIQHLRVSHLITNFRTYYRGNSLLDVSSFIILPPTADGYFSYKNNF